MQTSYSKRRLFFFSVIFIFDQYLHFFFCCCCSFVSRERGEREGPVSLHHSGTPNWPTPPLQDQSESQKRLKTGSHRDPEPFCPAALPARRGHRLTLAWRRTGLGGKRGDWLAPCFLCGHRVRSRTVLFRLVSFRPANRRSEPRKLKQRKKSRQQKGKNLEWVGKKEKQKNKKEKQKNNSIKGNGKEKKIYPKQQ